MMASIEMRGLDEYTRKISELSQAAKDQVIGPAIYEGAAIVAEAVQREISAIPTDTGWGSPERPLHGLQPRQKAALHNSFGISKMRDDDGYRNVKLGFDGYNTIRTKRWPKGQPNAMIARSLERGTSWLKPYKFMKKAVQASKAKAIGVMQTEVDSKIYALMRK